ncbi:MAG TPA: hypothetical protein VFE32_04135 [Puia sp.]|nr:hypothetical protein [Puia sp.]
MTIQKMTVPDPRNGEPVEKLIVDGKPDMASNIRYGDWQINSPATFFGLLEYTCEAGLFNGCQSIYYHHREKLLEYPINVAVAFDLVTGVRRMMLFLAIDLYKWNKPYSFNSLKSCFKSTCETMKDIVYSEDSEYEDGASIELTLTIEDPKLPLSFSFNRLIDCLVQLRVAEADLLAGASPDDPESLTATFDFPPEVRSACNQYLMYFGQFLQDLGILADTSLKEHMNKVLFTVTPHDKDQALDVIYEALDVYLHAPDAEMMEEMNEQDFAHYQWKLNIYHLKGQLELAKALLQAKDATIEALKIANYQVQQSRPISSLPAGEKEPAEKETVEKEDEEILGGAVSITKYKAKGFTINLPRIIRKLRRKK